MAVKGQNSCTLSTITDVKSIYTYHLLVSSTTVVTNNMAPKDATTDNPGNPPGASSITITYLGEDYVWTISEPGINIQTNDIGTLYYIECTLFSDNTFDWGPIMTSSSYEAAKQAFNKATIVSNLVGDSPQHFWWLTTGHSTDIPAGAYITYVSQESFKNSPNNQPNLLLQSEGISLRNGLITKAQMTSTGLEVLEGGIKGGQDGSNGFIYLSTIDYPLREFELTSDVTIDEGKTYYVINNNKYIPVTQPTVEDIGNYYEIKSTAQGLNINGHIPSQGATQTNNDPAWREIIGTKFGVDSEGNLYANNAHLSGATVEGEITATSLIIGNGSDAYNGEAAINVSGYDIVIYEDSTDSSIIDHENTTYLYPVMYHNGEIDNTVDNTHYIWFMDNIEPGTTGDAARGGIIASYGHSYRVTYDFDDSAVGTGTLVQERIVDPSKYITKISDTGITIHPEDRSGNDYLQINGDAINVIKNNNVVATFSSIITVGTTATSRAVMDANGVTIYKGVDDVAQFGATARIGRENNSRFLINADSLQAYSGSSANPYFYVDANGLSWGSNTAATTTQVSAAAQTATNYLSYDSINGLQIASSSPATATRKVQILNNAIKIQNDSNNYLNLNSNGMQIYNNGIKVADFNSNIDFFNNLNQKVMSVTQNSIEYYDGGIRRCTIGSTESEHYGFLIGQHNNTYFECEGYIYDDNDYDSHSVIANIYAQSGTITDTQGTSDVSLGLHAYANDGNKYHYLILNASTSGWNGIEASVAITVNSDERLKENICNIGDLSSILFNINPISYSWKDKRTDKQHFGFIAQDVKKALEDKIIEENNFALVEKNKAGYLNLSYTELIPLMIDIIQKHEKRIIELESQLEEK